MVVGILGAVAQSDIKRILSFTLVSHIGYMLFGVAIGSTAGLSGAIFYIAHHITVQTTLFLVAGLIEYRSSTTNLDKLGGLARAAPVLSVMFFVPAMNLAGIPPFSGFLGKLALVQAGVDDHHWLSYIAVAGAIVTSLLTLYAIAKVWNRAFWQPAEPVHEAGDDLGADSHGGSMHGRSGVSTKTERTSTWKAVGEEQRLPASMAVPTLMLVGCSIALTVVAGPLMAFTTRAAEELQGRSAYIVAVLGGGG
jgi:multicomponent Na+:H+ antiporter subunit D